MLEWSIRATLNSFAQDWPRLAIQWCSRNMSGQAPRHSRVLRASDKGWIILHISNKLQRASMEKDKAQTWSSYSGRGSNKTNAGTPRNGRFRGRIHMHEDASKNTQRGEVKKCFLVALWEKILRERGYEWPVFVPDRPPSSFRSDQLHQPRRFSTSRSRRYMV